MEIWPKKPAVKSAQALLGVKADGVWFTQTQAAYDDSNAVRRFTVDRDLASHGWSVMMLNPAEFVAKVKFNPDEFAAAMRQRRISGKSLVNLMAICKAESNMSSIAESFLYTSGASARSTAGRVGRILQPYSDIQIRELVMKGRKPFFATVYGAEEANYYGRGLIQLTWKANYVACAKSIGKPIDTDPDLLLTDAEACLDSAAWYWNTRVVRRKMDENIDDAARAVFGAAMTGPAMDLRRKYSLEYAKYA